VKSRPGNTSATRSRQPLIGGFPSLMHAKNSNGSIHHFRRDGVLAGKRPHVPARAGGWHRASVDPERPRGGWPAEAVTAPSLREQAGVPAASSPGAQRPGACGGLPAPARLGGRSWRLGAAGGPGVGRERRGRPKARAGQRRPRLARPSGPGDHPPRHSGSAPLDHAHLAAVGPPCHGLPPSSPAPGAPQASGDAWAHTPAQGRARPTPRGRFALRGPGRVGGFRTTQPPGGSPHVSGRPCAAGHDTPEWQGVPAALGRGTCADKCPATSWCCGRGAAGLWRREGACPLGVWCIPPAAPAATRPLSGAPEPRGQAASAPARAGGDRTTAVPPAVDPPWWRATLQRGAAAGSRGHLRPGEPGLMRLTRGALPFSCNL